MQFFNSMLIVHQAQTAFQAIFFDRPGILWLMIALIGQQSQFNLAFHPWLVRVYTLNEPVVAFTAEERSVLVER